MFLMDRAEIWICCGQGWGSTFLLNVKGGAGARFGRHEPAKMGRELVKISDKVGSVFW